MSILTRIQANGGDATLTEWRLSLSRGRLSDESVAWVTERRRDLARELWPDFDDWEERAAIREHCGGQTRAEAEACAYAEVSKC